MVARTKGKGNVAKTQKTVSSVNISISTTSVHILTPLLISKSEKLATYKKRRDQYLYESISPADTEKYESTGWILHKESKTRVRMKHLKQHKELLDDQVWCLFYRMGYPELNGENFSIQYVQADGSIGKKKIDVLAKDDETVVVIECKSKETRGRKALAKELQETSDLQRFLSTAIKKHYGNSFKPKIIWAYVTNNIIWSEADLEQANASNIRVITENEMQYFDAFIKHMGPAGRYQFLAEFLENQEIHGLSNIKVPAIRGKLGGNPFYSFVTTPRHLLKIAFVNHQALNHPDGRPAYQRMIAPSRIKEIEGFIQNGGYFPTNILINFIEKCRFDLLPNKENADPHIKFGWLYLPNKYKSAWIIDGQHRLYGYSHLDDLWLDQSLSIIAFEEMSTKDEADLFVTINQKQKSVQRSVIVSLQADLKWGSSDPKERLSALASALVKSLSSDPTSPFFQRFAIQGVVTKDNQSLTLPEFVNGLTRSGLLGRVHQKVFVPGPISDATDDKTIARARRIINGYFSKIRGSHSKRWEEGKTSFICTNPGIRAHLLLLSEVLAYLSQVNSFDIYSIEEDTLLKSVGKVIQPLIDYLSTAEDADIYEKFSRRFGEGGVVEYFDHLCAIIHAKLADFGSADFRTRLAKRKDERITQTHQDIIKLNKDLSDYITSVLKETYGNGEEESGEKAWWEQGIESQKAKRNAYERFLEGSKDNKKLPKEAYLDLLDYKDIVKQKNNWGHFSPVFNIPLPGEKGKTYYLEWLDQLNKLRRVAAHPTGARGYDESDYEFIKFIKFEFYRRLGVATGKAEE
ncbi:MAG: DGQHR domain-containing protein [Nitrosomonadales bacterium]|nr:DGQHR domain-containing protein [Nitrosomonadales bacterium]